MYQRMANPSLWHSILKFFKLSSEIFICDSRKELCLVSPAKVSPSFVILLEATVSVKFRLAFFTPLYIVPISTTIGKMIGKSCRLPLRTISWVTNFESIRRFTDYTTR